MLWYFSIKARNCKRASPKRPRANSLWARSKALRAAASSCVGWRGGGGGATDLRGGSTTAFFAGFVACFDCFAGTGRAFKALVNVAFFGFLTGIGLCAAALVLTLEATAFF